MTLLRMLLKTLLSICMIASCCLHTFAQKPKATANKKPVFKPQKATDSVGKSLHAYLLVQQMPKPHYDVGIYFKDHIRYTDLALKNKIEGVIRISMFIKEDGAINNVHLMDTLGYGLNEEILRIARAMPKWKPGKQNGKNVCVYQTIKIDVRMPPARSTINDGPVGLTPGIYQQAHKDTTIK